MKSVAVIGAGGAGLCCARHFSKHPQEFSVRVFERNAALGGVWVYMDQTDPYGTENPVHSGMYDALRTNLPKQLMQFTDFSYEPDVPPFMSHRDVLRYLREYAEHYDLVRHIAFSTVVEKVTPLAASTDVTSPRWSVQTRDLITSAVTQGTFDYVLVCNGHFNKPFVPSVPGLDSFPGSIMHSQEYREPSPFKNEAVLIIGDGLSGIDIMVEIATVARMVYLSNSRNPLESSMPANVEQVSRVISIRGNTVCTKERSLEVTRVIFCTGYLYHFPFLTEDCGILVDGKRVQPCYYHTFNAIYPSMAFIGLPSRMIPFLCFDLQVQWVLAVWRGDKVLPSRDEMVQQCHDDYTQRLAHGMPPQYAHFMGPLQWGFYEQLANMGGVSPLNPTIKKIYDIVSFRRVRDIDTYRDELNKAPPW